MLVVSAYKQEDPESIFKCKTSSSCEFEIRISCSFDEKDAFEEQLRELLKNPKHIKIVEGEAKEN